MLYLISLIISLSNSEEWLFFSFNSVNYATTIVEAEIIDEHGQLQIKECYRGYIDSSITIYALSSPSRFSNAAYTPSNNLVHQTCILFLKEKGNKFIPALGEVSGTSDDLIMSMVWVMKDSIYYGDKESSDMDPLKFLNRGDKKSFLDHIRQYNKSMNTFMVALNFDDQEKARILKESLNWTYIREPSITEISRCGIYGINALKDLLPKEEYTYEHRLILKTLIEVGREPVFPLLDSIYNYEFKFWRTNIESLRGTPYWGSGSFDLRYTYLSQIIYLMAENNVSGWRKKAIKVRDFFRNEKSYTPPSGWRRIDTSMDELLRSHKQ